MTKAKRTSRNGDRPSKLRDEPPLWHTERTDEITVGEDKLLERLRIHHGEPTGNSEQAS